MKQTKFRTTFYRKRYLVIGLVAGFMIYLVACFTNGKKLSVPVQIAVDYNKYILQAEINTEGYRGPVAARAYGYIGLAAYEAALPGFNGDFVSMTSLLGGLTIPQAPSATEYSMPVALNACYYTILKQFFMTSPENTRARQLELFNKWDKELKANTKDDVYQASLSYGTRVAHAVYAWSATDTLGHNAQHHNYDRNFSPPVGNGFWVTSEHFPMPPLLPYWGQVRTFVIDKEEFKARPLPDYNLEKETFYKAQAMEVLSLSRPLTSENQWVASFWNDDRPGLTFTPAGHWLSITNQVIEKEKPTVEKALTTYLKVGIALADAMVACWYSKYIYNLERPETFIQRDLDPGWRPYSPSPPFPTYPSGHSMMGSAAAEILEKMYGENYCIVDQSHEDLRDFETKPREFKSFGEMAKENALSRIYLGVHFRVDCEEGMRLGELIGARIADIQLENKLTQ